MAETSELADSAVADALGGAGAQRLGPLLAVGLAGREHVPAGPEDLVGDGDAGLLVATAAFKCFGIVLDYQPVRRRHFQEPRVFSAPLCQAALRKGACGSAMRLLKTASEMHLLWHLSASLRDLPS